MSEQTEGFPPRLPLFFVALLPQGDAKFQINNAKHQNSSRFACRVALKTPPHITIVPPFRLEDEKVRTMITAVKNHFEPPVNLTVKFGGVSAFENRTIFLDVLPDSAINAYDSAAKELVAQHPDLFPTVKFHDAFHPHVTLANRDILPEDFDEMMDFLNGLTYPTQTNNLRLEVLHLDRGRWEVVEL